MDPTIRLDQLPNHPPGNPGLPNAPAIRLEAITGRTTAHAGEATTTEVLLRIIGGGQPVSGARVPLNLCLVIDRSGSMDGQPLAAVRDACKHVVAQLGPTDILSIVTFEENVDIVLPAKHVTSPEIISAYIDRITAGNTTNLFDGLYAGGVQVTSVPLTGYASRLILLTDGEPTAGLKDPASILRQVEQLRAQGVVVSAMGFGPDYQEDLMASIARTGGGNYTYIAHAGQVAAAFQRELTGAMSVVATKAVLRFELPDNNQLAGDIDTMLPDIEAGTTIERLVTIKSGPRGTGQYRILKASVDATSPSTRQPIRASTDAIVTFADAPNASSAARNPAVSAAMGLHSAALDLEKTLNGMRTMSFSAVDVTQMLNRTQAMLAQTGRVQEAAQVADATRAFQTGNQDHLEKTLVGTLYALDLGKTGGPA